MGFRHDKNATDVGFDPTGNGSLTADEESSTLYMTLAQQMLTPDFSQPDRGRRPSNIRIPTFNGGGFAGETEDFYTSA